MEKPDLIVTAVRRAVMHLSVQGGRFAKQHGLNLTDIRALVALLDLERAGQCPTPGALGRELGLASASTTQVIDRLERAGMARREPDPDDRRRVQVQVTAAATDSGVATFEPLLRSIREVARRRTPDEQAVILSFLEDLAVLAPEQ